jgi:hypothetical protein
VKPCLDSARKGSDIISVLTGPENNGKRCLIGATGETVVSSRGLHVARCSVAFVVALGLLPGLATAGSRISGVTTTQVSARVLAATLAGGAVTFGVSGRADAN